MTKPFELPELLTEEERADIIQEVYWGRPGERPTVSKVAYEVSKAQRDKTVKDMIEWIEQNVNWRLDAPYKSTLDPEDFKALKDKLRRPEVK